MNFRRILFFGIWLALGVVGIGIVLPELNRARSSMDQHRVFENIASESPAVAESSPGDADPFVGAFDSASGAAPPSLPAAMEYGGAGSSNDTGLSIESSGLKISTESETTDNADYYGGMLGSTVGGASGSSSEGLGWSGTGQGGGGTSTGPGFGISTIGSGSPPPKKAAASEPAPRAAMAAPAFSTAPMEPVNETEALIDALDKKLASLPLGNIAFNTPESIPLGDDATIELLLSLKETEEQLREAIREAGPVDSARIQITDQMEARLTGLGFRIEAITPERQAVSRSQRTGWRWQIEPSKSDMLKLNLTLSAIVTVDGVPAPRTVQTFEREIYVEVPLATQVTQFAKNNVEVITTFLLVPVVGGIYRYARKKKRGPPPDLDIRPRRAA